MSEQFKVKPLFPPSGAAPLSAAALPKKAGYQVKPLFPESSAKPIEPASKRQSLFAPTPQAEKAKGPAVLFGGTIRQKLIVSPAQIKAALPDCKASDQAIQIAAKDLSFVVIEKSNETATQIGIEVQTKFAELSQIMLRLTSSPVINEFRLRCEELSELIQPAPKPFGWYLLMERKPSVRETIQKVEKAVDALRGLAPESLKLAASALESNQLLLLTSVLLESSLVEVSYLVYWLRQNSIVEHYKNILPTMENRLNSLLMSQITIQQATAQIKIFIGVLQHFKEINDSVLINLIPAWCAAMSSQLTQSNLNSSKVGAINAQIIAILQQKEEKAQ